jgi:transcriptional regulator of heat shock response
MDLNNVNKYVEKHKGEHYAETIAQNKVDLAVNMVNAELVPEQIKALLDLSSYERETFFRELARKYEEREAFFHRVVTKLRSEEPEGKNE